MFFFVKITKNLFAFGKKCDILHKMRMIGENILIMENDNIQENIRDENPVKKTLKDKKTKILGELKEYNKKNITDIVWFLIWTIGFCGLLYLKNKIWIELGFFKSTIYYICLVITFAGIICKLSDLNKNRRLKIDSNFELNIIQDDIFLEEIRGLTYEEKALKQLYKRQVDIERYHSLNLSHTKIIFGIGVFIIFIGIVIIACTIVSVFFYTESVQVIMIVSGFVGGLLIDVIGAIFILMYSKTIESAQAYQNSMVETMNTYIGNFLLSQINNDMLREEALSILAQELIQRK